MRRSTLFIIIFFSISIIVSIFLLIITLFSRDYKIDNTSDSIELIDSDEDNIDFENNTTPPGTEI